MTKPKNRLWAVCWQTGVLTFDTADAGDRQFMIYKTRQEARLSAQNSRLYCVRPITIKGAKL